MAKFTVVDAHGVRTAFTILGKGVVDHHEKLCKKLKEILKTPDQFPAKVHHHIATSVLTQPEDIK